MIRVPSLKEFVDRFEIDRMTSEKEFEKRVKAFAAKGEEISCMKCTSAGCCYQYVLLTPNEGFVIADWLRKNFKDTPELREKLRSNEMNRFERVKWFLKAVPCVFLKDNRCEIYSVRPTPCSCHSSFGDPRDCDPVETKGTKAINMNDVIQYQLERGLHFIQIAGVKDRLPLATLPRIVLWCLEALDTDDPIKNIASREWPTPDELIKEVEGG